MSSLMNASSLHRLVSNATSVCSAALGSKVLCHQCTRCDFKSNLAGVWACMVGSSLKCFSNHLLYRRQVCLHSFICFAPNYPLLYKHACNCGNNDLNPTALASPRAQARTRHFPFSLLLQKGMNALQFPKNRLV